MAEIGHLWEKGWLWRRISPSYNLAMLDARLAPACLAAGLLIVACGPDRATPNPSVSGAAGLGGGGGAGTGSGGAEAGDGGSGGSAGASTAGSSATGAAGGCGPLTGGGTSSGGAPAPVGTDLGALTVERVATWKDDATAAYTIVHDDVCDYNIDSLFTVADPELTQRGLRAAFGAIVQRCEERNLWSSLEVLRAHGHEIINHSWDHKDLVREADAAPLNVQIDQANRYLNENLVEQQTSFFIFPYDSFDDAAVAHLGALGYLGARAGMRGVNDAAFTDGLRVMFDVYGPAAEKVSLYWEQPDIMKHYVDLAITQGGWAVRELHGVADMTFGPVPLADYRTHLDYVKEKQDDGELWVDTPSAVLRYHFSRMYCAAPTASAGTLQPATPSCECGRYATPLSVVVTSGADAPSAVAAQDGKARPTKKLGPKRFLVEVDPLGGAVAVGGGT
ncbi:MAG: hypothetical protein K0R38_6720 [Polyangiaceae bacterium]|jgi:peptidoglycan/xylan/chitin deacetylase (PgdA/CDA1 family)|nr:hypothetical protein [Polyangiaceae bacterium]